MKKHSRFVAATLALLLGTSFFSLSTVAATPEAVTEKKTEEIKPYPLTTCVVTGNDLGSMGEEKRIVYEGQEIKFCCAPCEKKFRKNPAKYLAKLAPAPAATEPAKQP